MITPQIKALFQFVEYLHSNIENFKQYNGLIKELEDLKDIKNKLKPKQNYKDKLQHSQVQTELKRKFKTLQDNTANLIKAKARELNVCNFDGEPHYNFNGIENEILQLKDNFNNEDLSEIFKHKSKYLKYRSQTHKTFLSLEFFFNDLDDIAKSLFDYFKDTEQNEFEAFEIKAIPVNSIAEVIQGFKKGQTKLTLPTNFLFNTSTSEALSPQQTEKLKPEPKEPELSETIKKHFEFFNKNCPRQHKQILNDTDFKKLIDWTIWYFENEFEVPEISEPIKVVNTNKTFVQLAFKYLFKELHKSSPYPETLFELYRSAFAPYSQDKKRNFEAVRNNDNVKKLMQIDY
ncbi:hypothetical protein TPENAI_50229 [Tenacibaculum litopenaei]|uniref:hypothetical protein n=1 Tax=Tenacibaculum litopenaei TaxID=396016 RepID=UPI00389361D5